MEYYIKFIIIIYNCIYIKIIKKLNHINLEIPFVFKRNVIITNLRHKM